MSSGSVNRYHRNTNKLQPRDADENSSKMKETETILSGLKPMPTLGQYEADAESVERISSVANLSQLEMSSIAFIDEDQQTVMRNNLLEPSVQGNELESGRDEKNLKIFNDTVASDLVELINEINPENRRQRDK